MAGKERHLLERNGRYYARLVVPQELRAIVGKRELQEALGGDRRQASRHLPSALHRFNVQLDYARAVLKQQDILRSSTIPLSPIDLARVHYQARLAEDADLRRAGPQWASISIDDGYVRDIRNVLAGRMSDAEIEEILGYVIERYRRRGHIEAEPHTVEWRAAAQSIAGAELHALERVVERDEGADPLTQVHPEHLVEQPVEPPPTPPQPLSLRGLLEDHLVALERDGRGRAGRKAWPRVFEDLIDFLALHRGLKGRDALRKADDAKLLTSKELTAWRDEKLATLAGKTVKDVWIASVKAVLQRAVEDHKLDENPASKVKVRASARAVVRPKGYTDAEAIAVLRAAREYRPKPSANPRTSESTHITAAKRWGPWLCAFTGARVTEMMQLRRSDVLAEGDIHFLRITPDAGSVKSGIFRDVPLHPQLIELGFLDFVADSGPDPLFYSKAANPKKRPAEVSSGRLSTWLRSSGLTPQGVQPNHAWRHRFKTTARDLGLDPRVVEAIQGHAGRSAADSYGDVSLKAKHAAVLKLPRYDI